MEISHISERAIRGDILNNVKGSRELKEVVDLMTFWLEIEVVSVVMLITNFVLSYDHHYFVLLTTLFSPQ